MLRAKARPRGEGPLSLVREDSGSSALLPQTIFLKILCMERRRTERSGRHFVLMLLDAGSLLQGEHPELLPKLASALSRSTRDTDVKGWYKQGTAIGVIFTEIETATGDSIVQTLSRKVSSELYPCLSVEEINHIKLSFHIFPEDWDDKSRNDPVTSSLQMALAHDLHRKKIALQLKRLLDIGGSLAALVAFLPVFLAVAVAVRLTSKGPVLFRQTRVGQYGKRFTFLKFRSMYVNNDPSIHQKYVKSFISGSSDSALGTDTQQAVYKLVADPRVTKVGRFIRKTSLDELPQFWNVLTGDMSLVGPRPPVPYEFEHYDLWHKQRLSAVKPGITGLWQVDGRSRVKFDDMVRLDIRYAKSWSLWLDLKILLQTPRAVVTGAGAC